MEEKKATLSNVSDLFGSIFSDEKNKCLLVNHNEKVQTGITTQQKIYIYIYNPVKCIAKTCYKKSSL